jgi:superfamily II DNA or RNA helicase
MVRIKEPLQMVRGGGPHGAGTAGTGGEVKVLIATGQLIGEGYDCKELSNLFLATPIKFNGRLLQYLGRVLRPAPGKDQARVYDYNDVNVVVLMNAARARQRVYGQD